MRDAMRSPLPLVTLLLASGLSACTTTEQLSTTPAVEDFVIANELESLDKVRTRDRDSWVALNERYLIYKTRRGHYLFEFRRECKALLESYVQVPDLRVDHRNLRARVDTIRGCPISHIYAISREQSTELRNLGDAPGS